MRKNKCYYDAGRIRTADPRFREYKFKLYSVLIVDFSLDQYTV